MRRFLPVPLLLAWAAAGLHGQQPPEAKAGEQLQGEWVVATAERDKESDQTLVGAKYTFAAGKMTLTPAVETLAPREAAYRVLAPEEAGGPMRLAFVPAAGPNKGEEMEGIFRFKDGILELCHCGVPRKVKGIVPTDFKTQKNSGIVLLTLKKL